jgi:sister-chromatid-cohesion protein PDS5
LTYVVLIDCLCAALLRFSEILHACIEEFEGITEDLLDILLQPLLPAAKDENPTAFRVVAVVLRAVFPIIRNTVTEVIHNILVGSTSKLNGKLSEMAEDIYPLIYELHRIAPDIISDIIPSLCMQLKVEEEVIRHNAVKLLCSLFTSDAADYAKDFPRDFKDFLGRLNDLFVDIRQDMLQCCGVLLKSKPELTIVEGKVICLLLVSCANIGPY